MIWSYMYKTIIIQKKPIRINEFINIARYKVNTQKSVVFLYTDNEQSEKKIKKIIPFTILLMKIPASGIHVLWLQWTNSHRLQKSCGKKGTSGPFSKWERGREGQREPKSTWPLPGQAFIAFLGTLHRGRSSFTRHRFTVGDYLLQTTKERMLPITSKRKMLQIKGESGWTGYTPYLDGLAQTLGN